MPFLSRRLQGVALVIAGTIALGGAGYAYQQRGYDAPSDLGTVPVSGETAAGPASDRHVPSDALPPRARPTSPSPDAAAPTSTTSPAVTAEPVRLVLRDIGADAPVVPVGVERSGALEIPTNPRVLGWWEGGTRPGASRGSVVVVGHVDSASRGRGALFHLGAAKIGARVTVSTTTGQLHYRVVARRVYDKADLPRSVFDRSGAPRLVLITCGGPFNKATRHYRDNVVVYAVPA